MSGSYLNKIPGIVQPVPNIRLDPVFSDFACAYAVDVSEIVSIDKDDCTTDRSACLVFVTRADGDRLRI
jgi:hypothetical protein